MITVGIDIGTAAVKIAFAGDHELLWCKKLPSTYMNPDACDKLFNEGLDELKLNKSDIAGIMATGYGAKLFKYADTTVNEISANAMGAWLLSGKTARTIINVGGQDVKVISMSPSGKVADFKMNDKCAAGTGRFFEMAERILNIPMREFSDLGLASQSPLHINNTCAVFAETELVSLISQGKDKNDIIAGLNRSIANRIASLAKEMELDDDIYFDGGPAVNQCLLAHLNRALARPVKVLEQPQFTVAFGAASMCRSNIEKTAGAML